MAANAQRWGGVCGLVALGLGVAGGALERGWPASGDAIAVARYVVQNRPAILAQSVAFLLSYAAYLGFLGGLRAFLARAEGDDGAAGSAVAFGAGLVWVTLGMLAQAFQVGVATTADGLADPSLLRTMAATFAISNLPGAAMLAATAAVLRRHHARPAWLAWLSGLAAASQLLLFAGIAVNTGPLAPGGWLGYALYPFFLVWLVPTIVVMIRRAPARSRAAAR